jgi:hypothetical protein
MRRVWLSLISIALLLCSSVRADHLPENLLAGGKPEKVLASIHLERSRLSDVIRAHGEPSKIEGDDYYWEKGGWKLHLVIYRGSGIKNSEYIAMIEVEGANVPRGVDKTGRGLRLGDTISAVRRIYGRKFKERKLPKLQIHDVMVQWRREEVSLVAELDGRGRIKNLRLFAPE